MKVKIVIFFGSLNLSDLIKYKTIRIIISWVYNIILRLLFKTNFRDISTGSRLVSKKLVKKIKLTSNSPFIGAELAIKSKHAGFNVN